MKYIIRRAIFSILTIPVVFVLYGIFYFGLALLPERNVVTTQMFLDNLPTIAVSYVLLVTFSTQFFRFVDKLFGIELD